jgi:2-hydroxy-6-oxonona-2,4-dienedioate hydrolase
LPEAINLRETCRFEVRQVPGLQALSVDASAGHDHSVRRYIHRAHTRSPEFIEARRKLRRAPHDYTPELPCIQAPVLLMRGRYDRIVSFEVSIAILNRIAEKRLVLLDYCGHWPPFKKPAEWAAQALAFLQGY